jgi:hypothetical protein
MTQKRKFRPQKKERKRKRASKKSPKRGFILGNMPESFEQKKKRANKILERLKKAYPNAKIVLNYGNNTQLLVAVILSAQCTDKKVNEVTAKLFKKYKNVEYFAQADLKTF